MLRIRGSVVCAVILAALVFVAGAQGVVAGSKPVLASWQTNGRVETIVISGSTAYLGGEFTSVRPSGNALGTGEVARNHAAAINVETGRSAALGPERQQHRSDDRSERRDGVSRRHVRHGRR